MCTYRSWEIARLNEALNNKTISKETYKIGKELLDKRY